MGRTVERELLVGLLTAEPGPAIVFLHGPGGVGKTILLHGVLDRLGAASVRIDGRHVEPTPTGLLDAIAAVLGVAELRSVQDAAARLEATGTRLLAIDSYEHLGIIDGWLRNAAGRAGFSRDGGLVDLAEATRKQPLTWSLPVVEPGVDPGTFRFSGGRSAD